VQFAQWQGDLLESEEDDARRAREFWGKLDHAGLALPDEARGEANKFSPASLVTKATPAIQNSLKLVGENASSTLIAAWQVLAWRLSGQMSFSIGVTSNGRGYEELESAVGVFAKALPIHSSFEGDLRFEEVAAQAGKSVRDAIEVQEYYRMGDGFGGGDPVNFEYVELPTAVSGGGVRFEVVRQEAILERSKLKLVVE